MLVLTRKSNEIIHIEAAGGIKVMILGVRHGNHVKVGIQADPSVNIVREEIRDKQPASHRESSPSLLECVYNESE
jgi:carbon storage regulator CsrA